MPRIDARRIGLTLLAPVLAVLVAVAITSLLLAVAGDPVGAVWSQLLSMPTHRLMVKILNGAIVYYLSAVAIAIGFRMNLFNIGTEGQYRVAAFAAALFAAQGWLPGFANVIATMAVAMVVGGLWAAIPAYLKVQRGVSEVISSIMLNSIATSVVAFLLSKARDDSTGAGSNVTNTKAIPKDTWLLGWKIFSDTSTRMYSTVVLAALVGIAYWFLLGKTRFGFDLRAAGQSESAAVASGVSAKRMVVTTMILSGAVAGLIGMPLLLGQDHNYGDNFQAGLGFTGIGIALLGRNNPVGMAIGALLWSFLDQQRNGLQITANVSPELVSIIQGVIVLAVVIAYELVRRVGARMEQSRVARELGGSINPTTPAGPTTAIEGATA